MSHVAYAPVGYDFKADHYCLDCIPVMLGGRGNSLASGWRPAKCNCCECRLDRIAAIRGIDRYDERSFDSGDFPKSIPYHNDAHSECGPDGEDDWSAERQYCNARCASCGDVIDGVSKLDGPDVCPAFDYHEWSTA